MNEFTFAEMLEKARAVAADVEMKKKRSIEDKKFEMRANARMVLAQLSAIKELVPIVAELRKTGRVREFFTEGIHHRLGFSELVQKYVGVCGGECAGKSIFADTETGKFVVCQWYHENGAPLLTIDELVSTYWDNCDVNHHLKTMAFEMVAFAEKVIAKVSAM